MSEKKETDQSAARQKWSRYRDYLHKLPHTAFNTIEVDEDSCCMACDNSRPTLEQCTKCGLQLCGDCSSLIVQSRCRGNLHTLVGIVARWKRGFSSQFLNREEKEVKAGRGRVWANVRRVHGADSGRGYGFYEGDISTGDVGIEGSSFRKACYNYLKAIRDEYGGFGGDRDGDGGYEDGGYEDGGYEDGGYEDGGYEDGGYEAGGYEAGGYEDVDGDGDEDEDVYSEEV